MSYASKFSQALVTVFSGKKPYEEVTNYAPVIIEIVGRQYQEFVHKTPKGAARGPPRLKETRDPAASERTYVS